jgi:hypothetical protein
MGMTNIKGVVYVFAVASMESTILLLICLAKWEVYVVYVFVVPSLESTIVFLIYLAIWEVYNHQYCC